MKKVQYETITMTETEFYSLPMATRQELLKKDQECKDLEYALNLVGRLKNENKHNQTGYAEAICKLNYYLQLPKLIRLHILH